MTKFKKILIVFGVLGFLFLAYVAYANYRWNTEGASMFVPREKAIGVITNQYGIRDSDLEFINGLKLSEKDQVLVLSTARKFQDMIANSNNDSWIIKNHHIFHFRLSCMNRYFKDVSWRESFWRKLDDNEERKIFEKEYMNRSGQLGLPIDLPQEEDYLKCFDK